MADAKKPGKKRASSKAGSTKRRATSGAGKASASKKPAAKKTAPKKRAAAGSRAKKRAPAKKPSARKRKRSPKAPPPSRLAWVGAEVGTVALGLAIGLLAAGWVQYRRAVVDVNDWISHPVVVEPGVIWSAPHVLSVGDVVSRADLVHDLLAAGYERSAGASAPMQFDDGPSALRVHTEDGQTSDLVLQDGRITSGNRVDLGPIPLAVIGDLEAHRSPVDLDTLSPWVEPAVLSMEDARFRSHPGIDPLGVARAILTDLTGSGPLQGGSTLTQQLAKNLFLTQERTARRKIKEAFYAAALERTLGKDALLELYLGEVYLGQVGGVPVHGVEQGARAFFGVSASSLDAGQAATLAGIISSPNTYSPHRHPERATERRDLALRRMVDEGHLDADSAAVIVDSDLIANGDTAAGHRTAPWAVDAAVDSLEEALDGGLAAGYQVHTTIDPTLQRLAEAAVRDGLADVREAYPDAAEAQAALVAVRVSDGAIVAMVGSRDYAESPFNRATQALRQVGSTVKPLILAAAFDADPSLTPLTVLLDEPISRRVDGSTWTPANYDHRYVGEISVRRALEGSRNIPAVKIAETVGPTAVQRHLRSLGLSEAGLLPSVSLGAFPATPVDVAGAYTVFPGGGTAVSPLLVHTVTDARGATVLTYDTERSPVLSASSAALTTRILEGVITDGTGARVRRYGVDGPVGGKTGTTDAYRDAWFVGFTPEISVAVWVGTDRGEGIGLSGSRAAIPLWARFVRDSQATGGRFPTPATVAWVDVCSESERIARDACPTTYRELVPRGYEPDDKCDEHGGPLVEVGGFLQRLFRGQRRRDRNE